MLAIARELTGTLLADWRRWGKLFPLVLAANVVIATSAWVLVDLLMKCCEVVEVRSAQPAA
jgi:hypothetical protein